MKLRLLLLLIFGVATISAMEKPIEQSWLNQLKPQSRKLIHELDAVIKKHGELLEASAQRDLESPEFKSFAEKIKNLTDGRTISVESLNEYSYPILQETLQEAQTDKEFSHYDQLSMEEKQNVISQAFGRVLEKNPDFIVALG